MAVETGALALQRYSVKSARMLPPLEEFDRLSWRSSSGLVGGTRACCTPNGQKNLPYRRDEGHSNFG